MIYIESNELYHHGVKGQKWGVIRKRLKTAGHAISAGGHSIAKTTLRGKAYVDKVLAQKKAKRKEIRDTVKNSKRKDTNKMSDAELIAARARLKLENEYIREYNTRYPKRKSKVDKFLECSLEKLGRAGVSKVEQSLTKDIAGYQPYMPDAWKTENSDKKKKKKKGNK